MPSSQSFLKFETRPIEKKVKREKDFRKRPPRRLESGVFDFISGTLSQTSMMRKVRKYPMTNLGKRSQISPARAFSPCFRVDLRSPDHGEDKGPDADENIDEYFDGRGCSDTSPLHI